MKKLRRRIRVRVTADDIARGTRGHADNCAVALALKRVGFEGGVWERDEGYECGERLLPPRVQKFICDFDCERPVEPFTFRITV